MEPVETLELAAAAVVWLPYMWAFRLLEAHNDFVEDLITDMHVTHSYSHWGMVA